MIIYSLRPVSVCSVWTERKTNPKSEMTRDCPSAFTLELVLPYVTSEFDETFFV